MVPRKANKLRAFMSISDQEQSEGLFALHSTCVSCRPTGTSLMMDWYALCGFNTDMAAWRFPVSGYLRCAMQVPQED